MTKLENNTTYSLHHYLAEADVEIDDRNVSGEKGRM